MESMFTYMYSLVPFFPYQRECWDKDYSKPAKQIFYAMNQIQSYKTKYKFTYNMNYLRKVF